MKVKVTYEPGEEKEAGVLTECAKAILPGAKIKESCQHPPFRHIYIARSHRSCPAESAGQVDRNV